METGEKRKKEEPKFRYKNYLIYVAKYVRDRFDIFEERPNPKTGKKSKKLVGYGYRFEDMIEKLCRDIISAKDMVTFKDYVTEFKREKAEIQQILK